MKRHAILFTVLLLFAVAFTPLHAQAQITGPISTAFLGGLVNVNVQDVANNLSNLVVVDVNHISVLDGAQIDILRNSVITALSNNSNFLNSWNVLNDTLRGADLLNNNQVVVGVLNGVLLADNRNRLLR